MIRMILWFLIAILSAWLIWRRLRKGSLMAATGLIFGMIAAVYLGLCLLLFVFQSKLVYMPWRTVERTPADFRLAFEDLRIHTPDGQTLAAWYIPAEGAEYTVLFCHGNAGNISHRLDTLQILQDFGLSCLIFDYRGYGQSTGKPSEEGTILDALASRQWLIDHKQTEPDKILFFGRSLGGAVAAVAASRIPDAPGRTGH
jgi:pimeloyl-ACP methyl ester carboxylesterase